MNRIFKEPLLHFLLIGAAFFLLFGLVNDEESGENTIIINEQDVAEIVSKFEVQWKRQPTVDELTAILEKRIQEEIFYQEALKMNLDHNDEIIKRRLAQKMQFLSNDVSSMVPPSEDELKAFYKDHLERYIQEASYTFTQIYFSPDLREDWRSDAAQAMEQLANAPEKDGEGKGDPIALPTRFESTTEFHVRRQMGATFTAAIAELETGKWQGPVESGYGAHLVYIDERIEAAPASFEMVQSQVIEDYNYEKEQQVQEAIYEEFKKDYEIDIDIQGIEQADSLVVMLKQRIG